MIFIKDFCLNDSSVRVAYDGEEFLWLVACLAGLPKKVSSDLSSSGNWIYTIELFDKDLH